MTRRDIPNLISALRFGLIAPLVWWLFAGDYFSALLLFLIAGASDALDGYLARRNQWQSRLGSILDPLADKVMMLAVYLSLGWLAHLPLWLVVLVVARDLLIVGGALFYHYHIGRFEMAPSRLSKLNTAVQILLVVLVLSTLGGAPLAQWMTEVGVVMVLFTTLGSGLGYVWIWGRRALQGVSDE